jgi:hypothetical protein
MPTERQSERQRTRKGGRYARMEHCEDCDRVIRGGVYFSAPDCNKTGRGVVLCAACCRKHEARFYGFRVERTSATGLDVSEPWVTTCTRHATMVGSLTQALAYAVGYATHEFCDACREDDQP